MRGIFLGNRVTYISVTFIDPGHLKFSCLALEARKRNLTEHALSRGFSFSLFADARKGDDLFPAGTEDWIHVRPQQRNSRKILTTDQGIANSHKKLKELMKVFNKKLACNGTVIEHLHKCTSATE